MASVIGVRAHSWDRTIFGNVIGGEYGPIDFAGKTVYHCHILDHEDLGMMGVIQAT